MRLMTWRVLCLLGVAALAVVAQAGVVVEMEEKELGKTDRVTQVVVQLQEGKLRVHSKSSAGEEAVVIFDESKQVLWLVDYQGRSYVEMTAADVEQMGQGMRQMQEELAQMPPEERKMVEQMMKQRMGQQMAAAPDVTVQVKARGERVGPYVCTRYDVLADGKRTKELWAAPLGDVQLQEADFKTFRAMGDFFEPLRRNMPMQMSWGAPADLEVEGFPVRWVNYEGERAAGEGKVLSAERKNLEASVFAVPPGFKKTKGGWE
ncbi:MAG TPA: DUF4412 domain-containing protein [Candidatus Acidoferrales bacterium]|nr:DUF4412 domain-containing protein [Candidatus Acidoferrales bacterium]